MDFKDIMNVAMPLQSLTTQAGMNPNMNMMGMASSPFAIGGGGQGSMSGGGALMGLAGLVDQYGDMRNQQPQQPANTFQAQTPGAPTQPGRIDQTSFGGQGMDPMAMLEANIMRRFGGQ